MNSLSLEEKEEIIRESFFRNKLPVAQCSRVLLSQLSHMQNYGGINHSYQFVEREIMHMEGLGKTITKPATPFRIGGKLSGFKHKHFCLPGSEHIAANTMNTWRLKNQNSVKFNTMAAKLAQTYATKESNTPEEMWKFSGEIAQEMVFGKDGVANRFANAEGTGDWLIFVEHENKNYYLCIAKHDEDDFIFGALKNCISDFPFIEQIFASRTTDTKI